MVMDLRDLQLKTKIFNATSSFNYFEIQKYYQNEPNVYSIDSLSKTKDWVCVINLDEHSDIGIH